MSQFITKIPVALQSALKLLPKEAHVESVEWNGTELELRWSSRWVETPYTFHLDFPLDKLRKRQLPDGAKERKQGDPAALILARRAAAAVTTGRRPKFELRLPRGKAAPATINGATPQ